MDMSFSFFNRIINFFNRKAKRKSYKGVWNRLAFFQQQAVLNVIGKTSEDEIVASAIKTRDILSETILIKPDDVVVEIGCGIGRVGQMIAPLCKKWIGCDVSKRMLLHASKRLKNLKNVKLVEISGFDLEPLETQSVDVVYCTVVFMHLDEWDRYNYIKEAFRILKQGGRIFIDNFNLCSDSGWRIFEEHAKIPPFKRTAHISKSSTPQELETFLLRAGFKNVTNKCEDMWIYCFASK